ncbi:unnamed protein product [Symbiodinium sp. CCMP2592]|nr:unnamed protein product [Symbiodinium sp. CCMP2592]
MLLRFLEHESDTACDHGAHRPAAAFWLTRGPPLGAVTDSTNSWLYVPLLHAAAADLAPSALDAWRADPRATNWWEQARQLLAASAPVAPQTLIAALARTAETAPAHAHHLPDMVARIHDAGLPNGSLVHAGWAVRQLREPDGYLLSPVQEVLLGCYGGHVLASTLDRHSDCFRPAPAAAAPTSDPPPEVPSTAERVQDDAEPASPPAEPPAAADEDAFLAAAAQRARQQATATGRGTGRGRKPARTWARSLPACSCSARRVSRAFRRQSWTGGANCSAPGSGRTSSANPPPRQGQYPAHPEVTSDAQRARRAAALVHIGELSAAGHALTAQPLAAGTLDTLAELRDPERRHPVPYAPVPDGVLGHVPAETCPLPMQDFLRGLRSASSPSRASSTLTPARTRGMTTMDVLTTSPKERAANKAIR